MGYSLPQPGGQENFSTETKLFYQVQIIDMHLLLSECSEKRFAQLQQHENTCS